MGVISPGRENHVHQLNSDGQHAAECNRVTTLKVEAWNVCTMSTITN